MSEKNNWSFLKPNSKIIKFMSRSHRNLRKIGFAIPTLHWRHTMQIFRYNSSKGVQVLKIPHFRFINKNTGYYKTCDFPQFPVASFLQMGQSLDFFNQSFMHFEWNLCVHGKNINFSLSLKSSMQIAQFLSSSDKFLDFLESNLISIRFWNSLFLSPLYSL